MALLYFVLSPGKKRSKFCWTQPWRRHSSICACASRLDLFYLFIYYYLLTFFVHMPLGLYIAICYLLITHGGICTYLGVILILYALYILAFRLPMSVIRWLVVQEVCSRFEFACHFESHLAEPPSFYMRMRTTISDEHSIVTMLRSTRLYCRPKSLQRGCVTPCAAAWFSLSAAE